MTVSELLRSGRVGDARIRQVEVVKANPGDAGARMILFQILAFLGEWDKAERHLDILSQQNSKTETGVQFYRNLVAAERHRGAVLRGERLPEFMTTEPAYLSRCFAFREYLAVGRINDASSLLAEIDPLMPELSGVADGVPFSGFSDTDASLFPFLELFIHDRYLWMPFTSLRELTVPQPTTLLELLWTPAQVVTWDGLTSNCVLPVLYPDSASHEDEQVRMGRTTDWREWGGGFSRGYGQHVYQVGEEEKSLLELREVTFTAAPTKVES